MVSAALVIAGLDPRGANIRPEFRVNDLSFETPPSAAPQMRSI